MNHSELTDRIVALADEAVTVEGGGYAETVLCALAGAMKQGRHAERAIAEKACEVARESLARIAQMRREGVA